MLTSPKIRIVFEFAKRARRSARVARTGAGIYLGYKRTQRRVRKMSPEAASAAWEKKHEQFAEDLYQLAVGLRGLYVKTGQFAGTRSDVFPAAYIRSLSRLQDHVPPRQFSTIRATVESELGRPIEQLFARFDEAPLAAASLAQVHRAALPGGKEVAVKVQYPEVAGLVTLDVRNLRTLVGIVARREPAFDYRAIVGEISTQVPLELDFVREADLTRRVAANLAGLPGIVVPGVIDGMVTKKVLVTSFIDGKRLFGGTHSSDARPALAETITAAYGHQILVDGLFQADPHPGNILILPDGRVALLDFGLTKELPEHMRLGFARLVLAAVSREPAGVMAAFRELGVKTRGDNPQSALALMQLFFEPRTGEDGGILSAARRQTLRQNPVEAIPGDLVLLGRVIGLLRGVSSSLGAPLSPMQMLRPFAERVIAEGVRATSPASPHSSAPR